MVISAIQNGRLERHREVAGALGAMGVPLDSSWQAKYFGAAPLQPQQLKNFNFQVHHPVAPDTTHLIGKGKAKLVYSGALEGPIFESAANSLASKIDDVVYMVSRKRFFGANELKDELKIGGEIRNKVYEANLERYFESLGMPKSRAKLLSDELRRMFPTLESLVEGFHAKDIRLGEFYQRHCLGPVDWKAPVLQRLLDSCLHLSVDFVYAPTILIHGKSAVLAKKAECDLEAAIRSRRYSFDQNVDLVRQLFLGFRDLHAGGYIDGDVKLENVLLYTLAGRPLVKIADWGKCKSISANQIGFHTGNHRHMAPERLASQKGEVFSAAMLAVRILEEEFLHDAPQGMLAQPEIDPAKEKHILSRENDPEKSRKGIERYLCICKGCPEIDANWGDALPHIWGSFKSYAGGSHPNIDSQVGAYLDALHQKLKKRYGDSPQATQIIVLLKAMMRSNVEERLSMEEAAALLSQSAIS